MNIPRKFVETLVKRCSCKICEVKLELVWIGEEFWFIHCPKCRTEFVIMFYLQPKSIDCKDEEK